MRIVPLETIPNQQFTIPLDNQRYDITIKEAHGIMAFTIVRDDIILIQGQRAVAGTPIIPYLYLQEGNFMFLTQDGELPDYRKFQTTQTFCYLTIAEIEAL